MSTVAPSTDAPPGYAVAPHTVARRADLSRDARLLFVVLDGRQGSAPSVRVRLETLAADLAATTRSVRRWLDELRDVGLVRTQVTGRSLLIRVTNQERRPDSRVRSDRSREDSRVRSDGTQASALQSKNVRDESNNNRATEVAPDAGADRYLTAIARATDTRIRANAGIAKDLADIERQGLDPDQVTTLVTAYMAMRPDIRNRGGFIRWCIGDLAAGGRPQQLELPLSTATPIPPRFHELDISTAQEQATAPSDAYRQARAAIR